MNSIKDTSNIAFQSKEAIYAYQCQQLREELAYVSTHSPYYKAVFEKLASEQNIRVEDIQTLEDLRKLPITTKTDLQEANADFLAVSRSEIIDYVTTSGTLGDPVTFALTDSDLDRLGKNEAMSFQVAGCDQDDIIQLMTTIDKRFMAGLAYFLGARSLKCGIVRAGNGIPELQWDTIQRIQPTTCIVVPSFLLKLVEFAKNNGINHHASSLKRAICIGEPLRTPQGELNSLGLKITQEWPELALHSTYASTEMQSSFTECQAHNGVHVPVELIIVELLNEQNEPVAQGEAGEVTITTLGVRGMPLIRFKTGDMCVANTESCTCGRHSMRLSSVLGRKGQMIKYKGTTLYPSALYDILDNVEGVENYIIEVYTGALDTDQITIKVGSQRHDEAFLKELKDHFRSKVRVAPDIQFEDIAYIRNRQFPPTSRKQIKFIDHR